MIKKLFVVMAGLLVLPLIANANPLDLTTPNTGGWINGAFFYTPPLGSGGAGTGSIDSFLRIQDQNVPDEEGYNTDGTLEFDEKPSFTHNLPLGTLIANNVVTRPNQSGVDTDYVEIVLDINENPGTSNLITILDLEIYILTPPSPDTWDINIKEAQREGPTGYPFGATPKYDIDTPFGAQNPTVDEMIELDYDLFAGSGEKFDMIALFPVNLLGYDDTGPTQYFVLYSKFGFPDTNVTDGFEEYARLLEGTVTPGNGNGDGVIPEPGTLILLGSGLAGLAGYSKLRFRRKRK